MEQRIDDIADRPIRGCRGPRASSSILHSLAFVSIFFAMVACSKPSKEPPPSSSSPSNAPSTPTTPPSPPTPPPSPPPAAPTKPDFDLVASPAASTEIVLAAKTPESRSFGVPAGTRVHVTVTHVDGELGRISIDVTQHGTNKVVTGDAMTCAIKGCSLKSEIEVGAGIEALTVTLTADKSLTARLALSR